MVSTEVVADEEVELEIADNVFACQRGTISFIVGLDEDCNRDLKEHYPDHDGDNESLDGGQGIQYTDFMPLERPLNPSSVSLPAYFNGAAETMMRIRTPCRDRGGLLNKKATAVSTLDLSVSSDTVEICNMAEAMMKAKSPVSCTTSIPVAIPLTLTSTLASVSALAADPPIVVEGSTKLVTCNAFLFKCERNLNKANFAYLLQSYL